MPPCVPRTARPCAALSKSTAISPTRGGEFPYRFPAQTGNYYEGHTKHLVLGREPSHQLGVPPACLPGKWPPTEVVKCPISKSTPSNEPLKVLSIPSRF